MTDLGVYVGAAPAVVTRLLRDGAPRPDEFWLVKPSDHRIRGTLFAIAEDALAAGAGILFLSKLESEMEA